MTARTLDGGHPLEEMAQYANRPGATSPNMQRIREARAAVDVIDHAETLAASRRRVDKMSGQPEQPPGTTLVMGDMLLNKDQSSTEASRQPSPAPNVSPPSTSVGKSKWLPIALALTAALTGGGALGGLAVQYLSQPADTSPDVDRDWRMGITTERRLDNRNGATQ